MADEAGVSLAVKATAWLFSLVAVEAVEAALEETAASEAAAVLVAAELLAVSATLAESSFAAELLLCVTTCSVCADASYSVVAACAVVPPPR